MDDKTTCRDPGRKHWIYPVPMPISYRQVFIISQEAKTMNSLKLMRDYAKEQIIYWQAYLRKHPGTNVTRQIKYTINQLKDLL
jgi:hypothetical protein